MLTTQHNTRCPVYLHPAAASNKACIEEIQRQTGQLFTIGTKNTTAKAARPLPAFDSNGPWGGDAA